MSKSGHPHPHSPSKSRPSDHDIMASPESSERQNLCARCQRIDFDEIFNRKYLDQKWVKKVVLHLGPVHGLNNSCALCNLFATMADTDESTTSFDLLLTPAKILVLETFMPDWWGYWWGDEMTPMRLHDTMLLFLRADNPNAGKLWYSAPPPHEKGYLWSLSHAKHNVHIGFRVISPGIFDLDFVRNSLLYCLSNHGSDCRQQREDAPYFFRVIDCKARQVIVAQPGCQYLALSYVWGATTRTSVGSFGDIDNCPKVINDSIDVTLKLCFQYLWIDRYCINQLDESDKYHQIRQMDLIYANAEATIIAAAGDDPEYGLPGVNGTSRRQQPQLRVNGNLLASTLPHPSWSVNKSKWATRGWTYQEHILSKRRIVFTNDQVLFECNSMHCAESQSLQLDEFHIKDRTGFKQGVIGSAFKWKKPGFNPEAIIRLLAEFSTRELSYPTDAINAMQGIFQMVSKSKFPVYHVEGVPIVSPISESFVPEHSFIQGLSWFHANPGTRRPEFPSWSWAGWIGQLKGKFMYNLSTYSDPNDIMRVRLEIENGVCEKFPKENDWMEFLSKIVTRRIKAIHIQGWTLRCTVVRSNTVRMDDVDKYSNRHYRRYKYEPQPSYFLKFKAKKNVAVYLVPQLDLDGSKLEGKSLKCICLFYCIPDGLVDDLPMLVVDDKNIAGRAERVGCCSFERKYIQEDREWVDSWRPHCWKHLLERKMEKRTIRLG